jgi:hypothetical protein
VGGHVQLVGVRPGDHRLRSPPPLPGAVGAELLAGKRDAGGRPDRRAEQPLERRRAGGGGRLEAEVDPKRTGALVQQQHVQGVAVDLDRPALEVRVAPAVDARAHQRRPRTERAAEGDQAVQQRPRLQAVGADGERGVDRVAADVDVDAGDARAEQREQRIGRPQCGRERVGDAEPAAAGDRVHLGQTERDIGAARDRDRRRDRVREPG